MNYMFFNPLANNLHGEEIALGAKEKLTPKIGQIKMINVVDLDINSKMKTVKKDDKMILVGGDGTLSKAANLVYGTELPCPLYLYKAGTGNDFIRDLNLENSDELIEITNYIKHLPKVIINGKETRFINGIGYGLDGQTCEIADKQKAMGKKKINYTTISIKLCLFGFKCPNAKVTIDGVEKEYKKVWLASSMFGRYYGGGMKIAPEQIRNSDYLTFVTIQGKGRLKTLILFPKIFTGDHVSSNMVHIEKGKHIKVEFTKPCALQIDGETVSNVSSYEAIID